MSVEGREVGEVLLDVEVVFPVRHLAIQEVCREGEDWVTEESETENKADSFDDPVARRERHYDSHGCQDAQKT